jgi:hypothetical protein
MSNLLQNGTAWLIATLKSPAVAGIQVVYSRVGLGSASILVVKKRTPEQLTTEDGTVMDAHVPGYLIEVADLVLAGSPVQPQVGDEITESDGTVSRVMDIDAKEGCFGWRGLFRTIYDVHTKQVAAS